MKKYLGVWIDHSGATFVFLSDREPDVERIASDVEPRFRVRGGFRSKGQTAGREIVSESRVDARRDQQLRSYYREIIKRCRDMDGVLLLGPGEAKLHLAEEIQAQGLGAKLRASQAADKMTERQLVAKVKDFFRPAAESRSVRGAPRRGSGSGRASKAPDGSR